jgi:hypothetical protein
MTDITEYICGVITLCLTLGALIIGYHLHMRRIYADIAHEEARKQADRLFRDYTEHCEYRVHQTVRIGIHDERR